MKRPGYEADRFRIVLRAWPDGTDRVLTEDWDRSAGDLAWSPDGKEIFVTSDDVGNHALFAVDVATGKVRTVVGKGHVVAPQPSGGRVVYLHDSMRRAGGDLHRPCRRRRREAGSPASTTQRLASVRMGEPEQFSFKGANGDTVHALDRQARGLRSGDGSTRWRS